jgi:hypothetical protein
MYTQTQTFSYENREPPNSISGNCFPPKDFIKAAKLEYLTAQLSLPHQEESVIAFKEYQILASEQLKQRMPAQATRIDAWLSHA